MINICTRCWKKIFGPEKRKKDFFISQKREKCYYCGKRKFLIDGIVAETPEVTRIQKDGEKPYRTLNDCEATTLTHAIELVRLRRQAEETTSPSKN